MQVRHLNSRALKDRKLIIATVFFAAFGVLCILAPPDTFYAPLVDKALPQWFIRATGVAQLMMAAIGAYGATKSSKRPHS